MDCILYKEREHASQEAAARKQKSEMLLQWALRQHLLMLLRSALPRTTSAKPRYCIDVCMLDIYIITLGLELISGCFVLFCGQYDLYSMSKVLEEEALKNRTYTLFHLLRLPFQNLLSFPGHSNPAPLIISLSISQLPLTPSFPTFTTHDGLLPSSQFLFMSSHLTFQ